MSNSGASAPADVATSVATLLERSAAQGAKLNEMAGDIKAIATVYATKREVDDVREDVKGIKNGISWAVKIVVGAVIVAVLGLVIAKGGVPHL